MRRWGAGHAAMRPEALTIWLFLQLLGLTVRAFGISVLRDGFWRLRRQRHDSNEKRHQMFSWSTV
jgi:hypothetical protein